MTEYQQLARAIVELDRKVLQLSELQMRNHDHLQSIGHVLDTLVYDVRVIHKRYADDATRRAGQGKR